MAMFEKILNRLFLKKQTEFRKAFSEFSKSLTLIIDIDQLKDNVIAKIREIVHTDTILILLLNPDLNRLELAEARGMQNIQRDTFMFPAESPLIQWFTVNETYLVISQNPAIVSFFTEHEQEKIREAGVELIFPLLAMNRIVGLICLGDVSEEGKISNEKIELLNTLLGQAAFAFENAYLYQQQKARLRRMYRADRLAMLGQLAAGAAHEIRNPLTSIRSTIQYLQKGLKDSGKSELVSGIIDEVDRINDIIEGLLSFSKPDKPKIEQMDLEQLMEQTISLIATTARKRNILVSLDNNTPEKNLNADPSQLKQVFLNIIMNSIQAMPDGGELHISIDLKTSQKQISVKQESFYIVFRDTGEGIPQEQHEHIFDPFFTSKKDGTGLGLSISYGIIQRHHGDIEIESATKMEKPEDHGTKVTIIIPIMK
ncbi:ATP-binding protein [Candidatus Latescibacterota bacterium]